MGGWVDGRMDGWVDGWVGIWKMEYGVNMLTFSLVAHTLQTIIICFL